jgi:MFS family permease
VGPDEPSAGPPRAASASGGSTGGGSVGGGSVGGEASKHDRTRQHRVPAGATFSSLHNRNYRNYFIGQVISLIGSWMQMIALPWLVYERTRSGTALGLVVAVQSLPVLLLAPYGGVVVDRMDKRRLLMITQSSQGALALVLGVLTLTHSVQIWMIVVIALGAGLAGAFDNPARQSIVLELVGKSELRNAVSLNSVTINTARAVGPAVAAAVIATLGVGECFVVNAASFGAVILALATLDRSRMHPTQRQRRERGQLRSGLAYVAADRELRTPLIMMALVGTLAYEYPVSLVLFAHQTFHGGASTYSFLTTALGAGAVLGGLWVAGRGGTGIRACALATGEYAVTTLVVAVAPTLPVAIVALFASGLGYIAFNSVGNATLQLASRPEMRGRVMGLWSVAFQGSTLVGSPIVGFVGEHAGARFGIVLAATAALAATATAVAALVVAARSQAAAVLPAADQGALAEQT